jgi:hypothetical protein
MTVRQSLIEGSVSPRPVIKSLGIRFLRQSPYSFKKRFGTVDDP